MSPPTHTKAIVKKVIHGIPAYIVQPMVHQCFERKAPKTESFVLRIATYMWLLKEEPKCSRCEKDAAAYILSQLTARLGGVRMPKLLRFIGTTFYADILPPGGQCQTLLVLGHLEVYAQEAHRPRRHEHMVSERISPKWPSKPMGSRLRRWGRYVPRPEFKPKGS